MSGAGGEVYSACVVGGGVGGRLSMDALEASDRFALRAVCDLREDVRDRLRAERPGVEVFDDHEQMFRRCPVELACVSTFPPSHEPVALAALEHLPLKAILVEKPLGHTAASGRRILAAIREAGLPVAVPHGLLVSGVGAEVIERVRGGDIGELKLVEVQNRRWDLLNAGIHWLDFALTLTGRDDPVASVLAAMDTSTRTHRDGVQVETVGVTSAQTRGGVRIVLHLGDDVHVNQTGRDTLFRLVGTGGVIEFYGWDATYRLRNAEHPGGRVFEPAPAAASGHQLHLEAAARMADAGAADHTVAEASLAALEVCEAAFLSHEHRCAIDPTTLQPRPAPADWRPGEPYAGNGGGRDGRKLDEPVRGAA